MAFVSNWTALRYDSPTLPAHRRRGKGQRGFLDFYSGVMTSNQTMM